MPATPEEMLASMIRNFSEKTGKPLEEWVRIAKKSGLARHGEIVGLLKGEHGLGHGYANLVAQSALKGDAPDTGGDGLVEAQYAGAKAPLRPIYDAIIAAVSMFGSDLEVSPKKAYVSLRRNKQFGLVQPSTATRIDVGINLMGTKATGRLEASGSFNSMVSHRVRVATAAEVDEELIGWLKAAYNAA